MGALVKQGNFYNSSKLEFEFVLVIFEIKTVIHRFIEQSFRLCGRRRGWDVSREQHRNMYTVKGETDYWPRLDA